MSELARATTVRTQPVSAAEQEALGEPLLRVRDLRIEYAGSGFTLELESLTLRRGERIALLGPSGSGKTTLLRAIKGLVPAQRGEVALLGAAGPVLDPEERNKQIALIYQQFSLVGRLTVYENVLAGCLGRLPVWRSALGLMPARERSAAVGAVLELGLEEQLLSRADRISGGQQQRVAIARAIVQHARVVLADEPIASLDPETGAQVMDSLLQAAALHGQGLVMTFHDPAAARLYANRVIGLREGRVLFDAPTADMDSTMLARLYRGEAS